LRVRVDGQLTFNTTSQLLQAALAGHGLAYVPEGMVEAHLAKGRLKRDRKSTRLNSSHRTISYAVFCLKKKNWRNPVWMRMRLLPVRRPEPATRRSSEIGRAHVCTPVTFRSRMPSSA